MNNLILIKKDNKIDEMYVPTSLVIIDENENNFHEYLNPELKPSVKREVFNNFYDMRYNALLDGLDFIIDNGYRSYEYQNQIWLHSFVQHYNAIKNCGLRESEIIKTSEELTDKYVARAGYSEHQTGLAIDIATVKDNKCNPIEASSKEYEWLLDNSYLFGFILRYPEGKSNITGYSFEPWHYRYVGRPYSDEIASNNMTLEEYHQLVLTKK